ncbi:hypothetical protein BIFLAC_02337 [Bifidobacterium animalis subsp. lactis HN019]|nr:hypothetical protein BIFLAC_02337 [Bifidobacterium animalis subsp. lactis HN019]
MRFESHVLPACLECAVASVFGGRTELFLNLEQAVVLGDALATCRGAGLDLAGVLGDGEIGDRGVRRLARTMGDHGGEAVLRGQLDGVEGLGNGANLVELDQQGVAGAHIDALLQTHRVGDEQIVADELQAVAKGLGDLGPVFPAFLLERILDGDDRELVDELLVEVEHVLGITVLTIEVVLAGLLVVELGGGDIEGDADLLARLIAGGGDGVHDVLEGILVGLHLRSEAALIAETGGQTLLLQHVLEGVVHLDAGLQSLGVGLEAVRGDHVLLDVGGEVSVCAAVHDVHVRNRENMAVGAADIAVQRQFGALGGRIKGGEGDTEDGVGAQTALVRGAVELDHQVIECALVGGVHADDLRGDLLVHRLDGTEDTLALIDGLVAIATLPSLGFAGGGAGGNETQAASTVIGVEHDLNGRVAAGIKNLACVHAFNCCHNFSLMCIGCDDSFQRNEIVGRLAGADQKKCERSHDSFRLRHAYCPSLPTT